MKEILSISGEALKRPREQFDIAIKSTLTRMRQIGINTAKIKMELTIDTETGVEDKSLVIYPKISYKVSAKLTAEAGTKGVCPGQMKIKEMVDPETGEIETYIADQNMNMLDDM